MFGLEAVDEGDDPGVFLGTGVGERGQVVEKDLIQRSDAAIDAFETTHPRAVADEDVVEGPVDRAEEGAAVGTIGVVFERAAGFVQPAIGPAVIAGEGARMVAHRHASAGRSDRSAIGRWSAAATRPSRIDATQMAS